MKRYLLLPVSVDDADYFIINVLVDLDEDFLLELRNLREAFMQVKSYAGRTALHALSFWQRTKAYITYNALAVLGWIPEDDDEAQGSYNEGRVWLDDIYGFEDIPDAGHARVDVCQLHVMERGFSFSFYVKHGSREYETTRVEWSELGLGEST